MLPASRSGTTRMSACPATGESIFLIRAAVEVDRVVERQRAVEDAAGDLPAVGHLAQRAGFDRGRHVRIDRLHRRQDRHVRHRPAQGVREIDRVLDDVDLVLQRGGDVDRASVMMSACSSAGTSMTKQWLMRRLVRRPVSRLTTAPINSSVCRLPFTRLTFPSCPRRTAASAASLCGASTIDRPVRSKPSASAATRLIFCPTRTGMMSPS